MLHEGDTAPLGQLPPFILVPIKKRMMLSMLQRVRCAPQVTRSSAVRGFAAKTEATLRPIHVEQDEEDAAQRPFRIVGVRDVEVQDWEYPTRIEAEQKKQRTIRNRFQHPNFISLWVDQLPLVESYLKEQKIPHGEGIVKGPDGHDTLVIQPSEDGSLEFFNLCDNPTLVEVVQATPEVIKEFEDEGDEEEEA